MEDEMISNANQITEIGMKKFIKTVKHEIKESENKTTPARNGLRSKINDFRLSLKRNLSSIVTRSNNKNMIIAISHSL